MPKKDDRPEALKPYLFHGLDLQWSNRDQATSDCPFCGGEAKFHVGIKNGLWKCFTCDAGGEKGGGNSTVFLRELWAMSSDATTDLEELSSDRLVEETTLIQWKTVRNPLNDRWMVPGYNPDGSLLQLYKYTKVKGKKRLLATPTKNHPHCLFGYPVYRADCDEVYLCEGPWDAMALWEQLQIKGSDSCVLGTPGANVFKDSWSQLFTGKSVNILFDNDHPKTNRKTGQTTDPAGYAGARRVSSILTSSNHPPVSINYLQWGEGGFDRNIPDGTDVRDFLNADF